MPSSNLHRRVRNLEARLIDISSGLVPNTQPWRDYWFARIERMVSGEEPGTPGCIPLEVVDAYIASATAQPECSPAGLIEGRLMDSSAWQTRKRGGTTGFRESTES